MNRLDNQYSVGIIRPLALAITIVALFFLYHQLSNILLAYAGIAIMLLSVIVLNPLECFLIAIGLNSNIRMIMLEDNPLAIQGYFMFLFQLKFFLKSKSVKPGVFYLNFILACLTAVMVNDLSLISWVLRGLFFVLFALNVYGKRCPGDFIEKTLQVFIIGTLISQILILYTTITSGMSIYEGNLTAMNNDRNFNAAIVANSFAVVMFYLLNKDNKMPYVIIAILLVFTGMLSGSRTFLLAIGLTSLLYVFVVFEGKTVRNIKFVRGFVLISFLTLVYIYPIISNTFDDILFSRFMNDDMASGSGRFDAWAFYLSKTFSSVIGSMFGNGDAVSLVRSGGYEIIEHNTFIQGLYTFGLFGFTTLFLCYVCEYNAIVIKGNRIKFWYFSPLLITLFFYSSISALYSAQFDTGILMSILIIRYLQSNQIKVQLKNN